ncbi:serine/threonine-protein kinase [Nannocystis sp. ILAH1]|uniref:serine/threonine-protein kinase n=1 Tax=Nannocystis sp. ILAH1 TaxID=2996789 RepID=UPI00226F4B8A|nr:serine/threonine-protein kinase [Nannocystis sp. ILAH1]MCY0993961.1 serine/threonine-protein kinase [Nannocystis sp. ILAH1]
MQDGVVRGEVVDVTHSIFIKKGVDEEEVAAAHAVLLAGFEDDAVAVAPDRDGAGRQGLGEAEDPAPDRAGQARLLPQAGEDEAALDAGEQGDPRGGVAGRELGEQGGGEGAALVGRPGAAVDAGGREPDDVGVRLDVERVDLRLMGGAPGEEGGQPTVADGVVAAVAADQSARVATIEDRRDVAGLAGQTRAPQRELEVEEGVIGGDEVRQPGRAGAGGPRVVLAVDEGAAVAGEVEEHGVVGGAALDQHSESPANGGQGGARKDDGLAAASTHEAGHPREVGVDAREPLRGSADQEGLHETKIARGAGPPASFRADESVVIDRPSSEHYDHSMSTDSADGSARPPSHIEAELAGTLRALGLAGSRSGDPPVSSDAPRELERGTKIDRFVVLRHIGAGGQADVYEVDDDKLERKVALKLIHLGPEHRKAVQNARLLREAKALAKLEHPNVVRVHDAGTFQGAAYLVMEIKPGESLREWLMKQRRRWPEILEKFVAAGRGLHAAHQQGIVHRDFKPDNVFIDKHVGAVLGDFGLAFVADEPVSNSGETQSESGVASETRLPLTEDGHRLGTPGYIAPECERGGRATARSDQYSFCVSLYEALFGRLPRPGVELRTRRWDGQPLASLVRALRRGLAEDPAARFADVEALLAALTARPRRWLTIAASAAAVAVILGGAWAAYAAGPDPCVTEGEEQVAAVWNESRNAAAAVAAVELPFAERASDSLQTFADSYGERWRDAHTAMCAAPSEAKRTCLDRHLKRFDELLKMYAEPDPEGVTRLIEVLGSLDEPAECGRPDAPMQADTPEWLRDFLDRLELQVVAGDFARATANVAVALDASHGYPAAHARALHLSGWLDASSASSRAAIDQLEEAAKQAAKVGDFDTFARAATYQLKSLVNDLGEHDEAAQKATYIQTTMARVPAESPIRRRFDAEFAEAEGLRLEAQSDHERAVAHHSAALALREALLGEAHPTTAKSQHSLGVSRSVHSQKSTGRERDAQFDMAREHLVAAVQIRGSQLGEAHPQTIESVAALAEAECTYMRDFLKQDSRALDDCLADLELARDLYRDSEWDRRAFHRRSLAYANFAMDVGCRECAERSVDEVFAGMETLSEIDPRERADAWALRAKIAFDRKDFAAAQTAFVAGADVLEAAGDRGETYSEQLGNAAASAVELERPGLAAQLLLERRANFQDAGCRDRKDFAGTLDWIADTLDEEVELHPRTPELRRAAAELRGNCR